MRLPKGPWRRGSREQLLSYPTLALGCRGSPCPLQRLAARPSSLTPFVPLGLQAWLCDHFPNLCLLLLSFSPASTSLGSNCLFCKGGQRGQRILRRKDAEFSKPMRVLLLPQLPATEISHFALPGGLKILLTLHSDHRSALSFPGAPCRGPFGILCQVCSWL